MKGRIRLPDPEEKVFCPCKNLCNLSVTVNIVQENLSTDYSVKDVL